MAIKLRRDLEEIVREDVERGPYKDADEYLERAVTMLHAQEKWLAAHRDLFATEDEQRSTGVESVGLD